MNTLEYILKKYDINIGRRYIVDIPNVGREHLAELFADLEFNLGAEIGVNKGSFSELLCQKNPNLHLYSIDPWRANAYEPGIHGIDTDQRNYDAVYKEAVEKLKPYNCDIMRQDSVSASKYFPDDSLDYVYIDANHEFMNVVEDIHIWSKKVRQGGIVSGHDYAYFPKKKHNHVKYVVQAYTRAYGIIPHFIVGAEAVGEPGIVRDKIRSWFWVKQ